MDDIHNPTTLPWMPFRTLQPYYEYYSQLYLPWISLRTLPPYHGYDSEPSHPTMDAIQNPTTPP